MTKITWLGEDTENYAGPSYTTCFDMKFPKGQAVEVSNPDTIERARKNRFFSVEGDEQEDAAGVDDMKIADLRDLAEAKGIDHTGMSKADLRDALK